MFLLISDSLHEEVHTTVASYELFNINACQNPLLDIMLTWFDPTSFPTNCHFDVKLNLLKPTGHVMHQQFNIQQLYVLPTLYLFVLYLSENKQRLVRITA